MPGLQKVRAFFCGELIYADLITEIRSIFIDADRLI